MVLEVKYTFNLFSDTFLNIAIYTHIWFYKPFFGPYYRSLYPWRCNTWWIQGWSIRWNISLQMSQAVYHNKWQKNVLQREVGVKLMGVAAAAVKKIFAYLLRLKNGTPRGFNIILHTALVCLPFFLHYEQDFL